MFTPRALSARYATLILGDFLIATLAARASFYMVSYIGPVISAERDLALLAPIFGLLYVVAINFEDLYSLDRPRSSISIVAKLLTAALKLSVLLALATLANDNLRLGRRVFVIYVILATLLLIVWRLIIDAASKRSVRSEVLVLGSKGFSRLIAREIEQHSHLGYRLASFSQNARSVAVGENFSADIDSGQLGEFLDRCAADVHCHTLVVESAETLPFVPKDLLAWRFRGLEVVDGEAFYERVTGKLPIGNLRESWLAFAPGFTRRPWRVLLKRIIDVVAAVAVGICALPIFLLTAIAVKVTSRGPVFYSQIRVGMQGRPYRIYKFRSMREDAEKGTGAKWATIRDTRVTRVGRLIRPLRIDELPQLLNIIKGDMSLVGPRPERPEIVGTLSRALPLYDYRHSIRPGLTGWAQVCYSYGASLEDAKEKLCYDLYYVKNWSLGLDLQIMLQTIKVVLYARGGR